MSDFSDHGTGEIQPNVTQSPLIPSSSANTPRSRTENPISPEALARRAIKTGTRSMREEFGTALAEAQGALVQSGQVLESRFSTEMTAAQQRIAKTEFEVGQMQLRFSEAAGNIHQLQHQLSITVQQLQGVMMSQENQQAKLDHTATAISELSSQVTSSYSRLEGIILSTMQTHLNPAGSAATPASASTAFPSSASVHQPAQPHTTSTSHSRPKFMPELKLWSGDRNTFTEWYNMSTFALSTTLSKDEMEGSTAVNLLLQLLSGPAFTAAFPCRARFTQPQHLKTFLESKFGVVHADTFNTEMCKRVAETQHTDVFEWERTFRTYADQLLEDPVDPNIDILSRRAFKLEHFVKGLSDQLKMMVSTFRPKFTTWTDAAAYLMDVEMDMHRSKYVLSQALGSAHVQAPPSGTSPMDINVMGASTSSLFDDGVQVKPAPGLPASERKLWYAKQTCKRCNGKGHTHISALYCKLHSGHANAVTQAGKAKSKASVHVVQHGGGDSMATKEWVLQQLSSKE